MNRADVIKALSEIDASDPEAAHAEADELLLTYLNEIGEGEVTLAYGQVIARCGWWATA